MQLERKLTITFFTIYLLALVWIIVFKLQFSFDLLPDIRGINLLPFYESNIKNASVYIYDKIYNTLFFIPFGIYMSLLRPEWSVISKIKPIFLTSLAFEVIQYIFGIGATDISDLILNTFGGILGLGLFYVIEKILQDKSHILINSLALIVMILLIVIRLSLRLRL
jgi:glycopeptide antibiotics resistance protein